MLLTLNASHKKLKELLLLQHNFFQFYTEFNYKRF